MILSLPAYGEIYSWKDAKGITHFGDKVVRGVEQNKVELKVQESKWEKYVIDIIDVDNILTGKERHRIEREVNAVYQFFDRKLYFDIYKTIPIKIRLYEKQESYDRYLSDKASGNRKGSRGIYLPKTNEIVLTLNQKERWRTFWTIKHETTHVIIKSLTPFVPAWFNEGLAENMESLGVKDNNLILHPHSENKRSARKESKAGNNLNVEKLTSLTSRNYYENMEHGQNTYQAYAGELVRMLLSTEPGKSIIHRMIHTYKRGSRMNSSYIIDKHYYGGLAKMQNNWNSWVSRANSNQIKL